MNMNHSAIYYKNILKVIAELETMRRTEGAKIEINFYNGKDTGWGKMSKAEVRSSIQHLQTLGFLTVRWCEEFEWDGDEDFLAQIEFSDDFVDKIEKLKREYHLHIFRDREEAVYWIDYDPKVREIFVNNILIAELDFDSENERVFSYLFNHQNTYIKKGKLEVETGPIKKELKHIVQNLNFSGAIKKIFFDVSNKGIKLKNPVFRKDLEDLKIDSIHFDSIR